MTEFGII